MAIEKIKGPQVEWTKATVIQLAVAGLLLILSLLLGWFAFANWRFKTQLLEGYEAYDSGNVGRVKSYMQDAISWKPLHTGARELLAKVLCDGGEFDQAALHYETLEKQGYTVPQVKIGLGIIAFKQAEKLAPGKDLDAKIKEAQARFTSAGEVPEAEIGLGHCELLMGMKLNDPKRYAAARTRFEKVQKSMDQKREYRARITRDGLIDYYTGLGKALSSGESYDPGATAAFRASHQYSRQWLFPIANVLSLEAQRLLRFKEGNEALLKVKGEITSLRNETGDLWKKQRQAKVVLLEPWLSYSLAAAYAWGAAGNSEEATAIIRDTLSNADLTQRPEPYLMDASVKTALASRDDPSPANQDRAVGGAIQSYNELKSRLPADEANKDRRARGLNNLAWMQAWRGGYQNNDAFHRNALDNLTEALKLYPDDYVYNRNMLVLLKRLKRPATAQATHLDKCKAAAGTEWADDFTKVQQYLERP